MAQRPLHSWAISPEEAKHIQERLASQLVLAWDGRTITTVGGVDVSLRHHKGQAAIVVFNYPALTPVDSAVAHGSVTFPYIP
ncbi:MAG: endonuclease V, partial [Nitrospirae bacterium]